MNKRNVLGQFCEMNCPIQRRVTTPGNNQSFISVGLGIFNKIGDTLPFKSFKVLNLWFARLEASQPSGNNNGLASNGGIVRSVNFKTSIVQFFQLRYPFTQRKRWF